MSALALALLTVIAEPLATRAVPPAAGALKTPHVAVVRLADAFAILIARIAYLVDPAGSVTVIAVSVLALLKLTPLATIVKLPIPITWTAGSAVQLVSVPDAGVPNTGALKVGPVSSTILPVPVTALVSVTPP